MMPSDPDNLKIPKDDTAHLTLSVFRDHFYRGFWFTISNLPVIDPQVLCPTTVCFL